MDNIVDMQDETLMVSIKCFTFNHEKYIRETLEGFIMQKTKFRFEAIVHDDASTDGTVEIIREYAEKYPNIIKPIYEIENQYSKKDGSIIKIMYNACKGKYIATCEGDDYWTDPYKLQKQVDFLETHPDFVMCSHNYQIYKEDSKCFVPEQVYTENIVYDFNTFISRINWLTQPLTCIYRKSALNLNDYYKYKNSKDVTLFYCLLKVGKGLFMKDNMAVYRVHNGGIWSGASNEKQLYSDLMTLKGIHDVENSFDSALAIKYFFIRFTSKFTSHFIYNNRQIMLYMLKVLFKYFGFQTFSIIIHLMHLKRKILFFKRN